MFSIEIGNIMNRVIAEKLPKIKNSSDMQLIIEKNMLQDIIPMAQKTIKEAPSLVATS